MKILMRIKAVDIEASPFKSLIGMLIGKNVINNLEAIRHRDVKTGDIIFYEED